MRKLTLQELRRRAWKVLTKELDVINVIQTERDHSARCEYDKKSITIWVDSMKVRTDHAVVHEILHKLLDKHFNDFATYHLFELWIESLEKPFFERMTHKEKDRWLKKIKAKMVIRRS